MEFYADDKVIVNPLRIKQQYLFELENNLFCIILLPAGNQRGSLNKQTKNVNEKKEQAY